MQAVVRSDQSAITKPPPKKRIRLRQCLPFIRLSTNPKKVPKLLACIQWTHSRALVGSCRTAHFAVRSLARWCGSAARPSRCLDHREQGPLGRRRRAMCSPVKVHQDVSMLLQEILRMSNFRGGSQATSIKAHLYSQGSLVFRCS